MSFGCVSKKASLDQYEKSNKDKGKEQQQDGVVRKR